MSGREHLASHNAGRKSIFYYASADLLGSSAIDEQGKQKKNIESTSRNAAASLHASKYAYLTLLT